MAISLKVPEPAPWLAAAQELAIYATITALLAVLLPLLGFERGLAITTGAVLAASFVSDRLVGRQLSWKKVPLLFVLAVSFVFLAGALAARVGWLS
ncbi:hypothetical protein [Bosea vaviloviae]|nr:hypothetical protein [Bosea vaviloviae]